jgi:hypothetical protein
MRSGSQSLSPASFQEELGVFHGLIIDIADGHPNGIGLELPQSGCRTAQGSPCSNMSTVRALCPLFWTASATRCMPTGYTGIFKDSVLGETKSTFIDF